jgi:uncharacterized damage-inducible protein DinB
MNTLLISLFKYKAWANAELMTALQGLNAATLERQQYAPIRILNHTYVVDRIFAAHLQGLRHEYRAANTPDTPTLDELRYAIQASDAWYIDYAGRLSEPTLQESIEFVFTDESLGRMTREEILVHLITHGGYHRGAIGRFLVSENMEPPRDIFTRYLHEAEPSRRLRT